MDDIQQLIFSHTSGPQSTMGHNGMYPRGGSNSTDFSSQHQANVGEQTSQYSYPSHTPAQQQSPLVDQRRVQETRQQMQQQAFQGYGQGQAFFQRSHHHPSLHATRSQSPSADPLGASVRSPPPPYPGGRPGDSRHPGNSPAQVPSPTSTGSPHTPLTPQTPRFPVPSPGDASKPPYSPSHPQTGIPTSAVHTFSSQAPSGNLGNTDRPQGSQARPGFIELSSHSLPNSSSTGQQGARNPWGYGGRAPAEEKTPFISQDNHENSLNSPTEPPSPGLQSFPPGAPPNKSPFLRPGTQPSLNHSPYTSSSPAQMPKSFSVESLTAPSASLDKNSAPSGASEQHQASPYSALYYPTTSSKYPAMFGQPQYQYNQYPGHMQRTSAFYNSQLTPNMYIGRGSMPVYPPNRDSAH